MKFKIQREKLLKPLLAVIGAAEKRPTPATLPILSNILLEVNGGRLRMTATDLEIELMASIALEGAEDGSITISARKISDICRSLPEEAMIEVALDKERLTIRSGKSRYVLVTLAAGGFPSTEAIASDFEFEISQGDLKELINRTQFCMANQDVRYYLNGLLLEISDKKVRAVATDGHRLAITEKSFLNVETSDIHQVIIPRKGIIELVRLLDESDEACSIRISGNHIKIELGDTVFTSKLVDGKFPEYARVMPDNPKNQLIADKEVLKSVLTRTSILSDEKYRGIRIHVKDNNLKAIVHNPEQEVAEDELEIDYNGDAIEIGFNATYLLDAVNAVMSTQVTIGLADANSSCLIVGVGDELTRYVVMPMRL